MTPSRATSRRVLPGSPFNVPSAAPKPAEQYAVNDRVTHDRHGMGTVVDTYGDMALLVNFGSEMRRITLPNPKLTKL